MDKQKILAQLNQLKEKRKQIEAIEQFQDTQQHAYKIFLNSAYGALGSEYYSCYDVDNAMSITKSGQTAIKEMIRYTEDKLKKLANSDVLQFTVAGDTDSVFSDATIDVNLYKLTYKDKVFFVKPEHKVVVMRNNQKIECTINELDCNDILISI